jgi:N-acetylmuramoyl-L-alanine amidase
MIINDNFFSPNFDPRTEKIQYVILHFTEMLFQEALERLCDEKSKISAHYLIKEDGKIFQIVEDQNVAWHAGKSFWMGKEKLNESSIGIELDNLGNKEFSQQQMNSCIELCKILSKKYNIPRPNFIGHSDVAPERKIDPGIFFDWQLMQDNGFGIWHKTCAPSVNTEIYNYGDSDGKIVHIQKKLQILGYKIDITGIFDQQTNYVTRAFQAKFCPHIIKMRGLEYYNDPDSKYIWDTHSNNILDELVITNPYPTQSSGNNISLLPEWLGSDRTPFRCISSTKFAALL